jgi:hypothetical protein
MTNIIANRTAGHGFTMSTMPFAGCAVPSHVAAQRVRGAVDLQVLTAKPANGWGHRTWSPPIT